MTSEATGEIVLEGDVLRIRRISVHYKVRAAQEMYETIERVHSIHVDRCPVARSIQAAIEIETSFEIVAS